ncbi:MAG: hypothetical protein ABRQ37_08650 [Candidatus Eremiobacterota bacterium]
MKSDDIKIAHANYDIVFKALTGLFKDQSHSIERKVKSYANRRRKS